METMKKLFEKIAMLSAVIFAGSMLTGCFFNPAPVVLGKIMVVSLVIVIAYGLFVYDRPVKYTD
jgi:hypothetical protein